MFELRPYQKEMKAQIYEAWDSGHKNVMLCLPTGMGKTITFCSIAHDRAVLPLNKIPTAIMVHRKELVQQISLTLARVGITHNIIAPRPTILGIVAAQRRLYNQQFYNYMASVSVVSVDTLNARITHHEKWAKSIGLWITDEAAHLLKNNKWGKAVDYFPNAIGLGVTATPQRLDKRGLGRHADGVFDVMVEGPSTRWGIENGYLCKYKIAVPKSDYQSYLKKAGVNSDFTREAMEEAAGQSHIVGDVVENYLKFASGKQAILFAPGISTAHKMTEKFNEAGIPAVLLTGLSTDQERLNGMIDFQERKIKILVNVDLFDEGLDVPGIECVIHARPTMSLSKYRQINGRGMRPAKNKEHLIIIDHVGNVAEHGLPCGEVRWTLDRIIKRRDKVNLIRICGNHECNSPYDRTLSECPWCGTEAVSNRNGGGGGGRIPPAQVDGDLYLIDPFTLQELESATHLEDPGSVADRVEKAAGPIAGKSAMKKQQERIATQKDLADVIAVWSGHKRAAGYSDRQIHKLFYLEQGMTITMALSQPRAEMLKTIEELQ
jgi:DNA repair protein RadD